LSYFNFTFDSSITVDSQLLLLLSKGFKLVKLGSQSCHALIFTSNLFNSLPAAAAAAV
jgi:hypothetical protein